MVSVNNDWDTLDNWLNPEPEDECDRYICWDNEADEDECVPTDEEFWEVYYEVYYEVEPQSLIPYTEEMDAELDDLLEGVELDQVAGK